MGLTVAGACSGIPSQLGNGYDPAETFEEVCERECAYKRTIQNKPENLQRPVALRDNECMK